MAIFQFLKLSSVSLNLIDSQHGFDGVPSFGVGDSLVDLLEIIEGDQAVEGKLSGLIQGDHFRDKSLGDSIALDNAQDPASLGKRIGASGCGDESNGADGDLKSRGPIGTSWRSR